MGRDRNDVDNINSKLQGMFAEEIIEWSENYFKSSVSFASSLGMEDQIITHMIAAKKLDIPIFTLDTGRLFNESYELIAKTEKLYGIKIKIYFPDSNNIEKMVDNHGINLFYKNIENRKLCCKIRKLEPLERALKNRTAWICGLRKTQSVTREALTPATYDDMHNMIKIAPLFNWSEKQLIEYITKYDIPYNPLHDKGFHSIGCACCTSVVPEGNDLRAGRWWWESPEQKECGLHNIDGKLVRINKTEIPEGKEKNESP